MDGDFGEKDKPWPNPTIQPAAIRLNSDTNDTPRKSPPPAEKQIDHDLKETFPASDPLPANPGVD